MNTDKYVNKQDLEDQLSEQLESLLSKATWLTKWSIEKEAAGKGLALTARISAPSGREVLLLIECRDLPRPSQFPYVNQQTEVINKQPKRTLVPVLAAPWISPRMAELCDEYGWGWFDLAGNCNISVPDALYLERTGFESKFKRVPPAANLATVESARVIRALLVEKNLQRKWTQRELKDACFPEVSLGLVNKVVRHLRNEAYLVDLPAKGGFKMHDPLRLLKEWSGYYNMDQHRRIGYFTLFRPEKLIEILLENFPISGAKYALGAFSAAAEQALNVRGETTLWIYMEKSLQANFEKVADARKVESGANIYVLLPSDTGVFQGIQNEYSTDRPPLTNPIQTYLDLLNAGGRGKEAADYLLEHYIVPMWRQKELE